MVAVNWVLKLQNLMVGAMLSEATLLQLVLGLQVALERWEQHATKQVPLSPTLLLVETSLRVNG